MTGPAAPLSETLSDLDTLIAEQAAFWAQQGADQAAPEARDAVLELLADLRPIAAALRAHAPLPDADPDARADEAMLGALVPAMRAKLAASRAKGRGGWEDPRWCSVTFLWDLLVGHTRKANQDFVDVANIAGMIQWRLSQTSGDRAALAAHVAAQDQELTGALAQYEAADDACAAASSGPAFRTAQDARREATVALAGAVREHLAGRA
ncbi:hypothetical protein [Deinococcus soli (ex Cha et al. 2016)]|uniref:Uncharacterized protein n=2 Tax=Deinococcus soli (ex Cha et al. 2016) TaxID=1309411 RepID=A0ACC6KKB4_9DEIO|nr:hypothetical protein [Deinococcus soli (ex Cha et al. 2016)]MDR6218610.1 hypothetical protein [Deinococcus soli (ex Cha et al. 2016)]MDR6328407.1 hypothetical protein [Deinococcus soli (ex Cha et al. 2016)]MDR6753018.1 hypothetical protein [Deinococcus soli (ex Cha et al. 2016)]